MRELVVETRSQVVVSSSPFFFGQRVIFHTTLGCWQKKGDYFRLLIVGNSVEILFPLTHSASSCFPFPIAFRVNTGVAAWTCLALCGYWIANGLNVLRNKSVQTVANNVYFVTKKVFAPSIIKWATCHPKTSRMEKLRRKMEKKEMQGWFIFFFMKVS